LRGFGLNQAGPRDPFTGFPIGGDALFINNLELRYPLIGENIGGVLFYDLGNVYETVGDFPRSLLRFTAPSTTNLNFTSHTVGTGLRYRTPVGPVRLDLGYNLDPPTFQVIQYPSVCAPGQSSCPVRTTQALGHLQFSFSIGQTF
jgi:outer membrane protein assembly factor BamA